MFEHLTYAAGLLLTLGCLGVLDWRGRFVLFDAWRPAVLTLGVGLLYFGAWDMTGIHLQIFTSGHSRLMSGLYIAPNFPVEEILFLLVLCYTPLLMWQALKRWRADV